jgi:hypothetical protein
MGVRASWLIEKLDWKGVQTTLCVENDGGAWLASIIILRTDVSFKKTPGAWLPGDWARAAGRSGSFGPASIDGAVRISSAQTQHD